MQYHMPLYRPPSEADSLILQVTLGCAHNACTFCSMYKGKTFRVKDWPEIEADLADALPWAGRVRRVFLADGDALAVDTPTLGKLLDRLYRDLPALERVGIYGGPKDILAKGPEELQYLRQKGLGIIYLGIESGSGRILADVRKGVPPDQMVEAGRMVVDAGILLSATVILGLGGTDAWEEHAVETAHVVSAINPHYLGALTLMLEHTAPLLRQVEKGDFKLQSPAGIAAEMRLMLQHFDLSGCVFRSNHASNYLVLKGVLNRDRDRLIQQLDHALAAGAFRPEGWRGL